MSTFVVSSRTVVDIDASTIDPTEAVLACHVRDKGQDETIYLYLAEPYNPRVLRARRPVWRFVDELLPERLRERESSARSASIRRMEDSIDPQDGVDMGTVRRITALEAGGGSLQATLIETPDIGLKVIAHLTVSGGFGSCSCVWQQDPFSRYCDQVPLGTITHVTATTRTVLRTHGLLPEEEAAAS